MSKKSLFDSISTDASAIGSMVKELVRVVNGTGKMTQVTLASITLHAIKHGDVDTANRLATGLVHAMPKNYNRKSLLDYLTFPHDFPGIGKLNIFRVEGEQLKLMKANTIKAREWMTANGEAKTGTLLMSTNHAEINPENPWKAYGFDTKMVGPIKKLAKDLSESDRADKITRAADGLEFFRLAKRLGYDLGDLTEEDFKITATKPTLAVDNTVQGDVLEQLAA